MDKTTFLTIYPSFESLNVVKETLPMVIKETRANDARLIVHDSSVNNRSEKWQYLQDLNRNNDFFLLLSDNVSMAHVRNMCLQLGQSMYAPDYICMLEDDHGYLPGFIPTMIDAMQTYYGKLSPNGFRYGLFTGCSKHYSCQRSILDNGNAYPDPSNEPMEIGRVNSCCRCAPASHWTNVLHGYDTDEYLISTYQTKQLNLRNYHKGFTSMLVQNGSFIVEVDNIGRGVTSPDVKMWDENYAASDQRSVFSGKYCNPSPSIKPHDTLNNKLETESLNALNNIVRATSEQAIRAGSKTQQVYTNDELLELYMDLHKRLHISGMLPISRNFGVERGTPVGRYFIDLFLKKYSHLIIGRCLEFGEPTYKKYFPYVSEYEVLSITAGPGVDYVGDLHDTESLPFEKFDSIICTQVFEHLAKPHIAANSLYSMLKPGGTLLFTVPFINNIHYCPTDYYRFTPDGCSFILKAAGFKIVDIDYGGNSLVSVGSLLGMVAEDFTEEELALKDPVYPYNNLIMAIKPDISCLT